MKHFIDVRMEKQQKNKISKRLPKPQRNIINMGQSQRNRYIYVPMWLCELYEIYSKLNEQRATMSTFKQI